MENGKTNATDWFASILDAYEKQGGRWTSKSYLSMAVECYTYYRETGDRKYLDDCETYLKVALPLK